MDNPLTMSEDDELCEFLREHFGDDLSGNVDNQADDREKTELLLSLAWVDDMWPPEAPQSPGKPKGGNCQDDDHHRQKRPRDWE